MDIFKSFLDSEKAEDLNISICYISHMESITTKTPNNADKNENQRITKNSSKKEN